MLSWEKVGDEGGHIDHLPYIYLSIEFNRKLYCELIGIPLKYAFRILRGTFRCGLEHSGCSL